MTASITGSTLRLILGLLVLWLGQGTTMAADPIFGGQTFPAGGAESAAIADLNGDGIADLAVGSKSSVSVLIGIGDGTFQAAQVFQTPSSEWQ